MNRMVIALTLGALGCAAIATTSSAQYELPGGTYVGKTNQARGQVRFVVNTAETRISKFVFEWRAFRCGNDVNRARGKTTARAIRVVNGRFSKRGRRVRTLRRTSTFGGGSQIERYRITGRLLSGNRATGTIRMTVTVRNRFGTTIDTCRMSRTARWRATRTGVIVP